MPDERMAKAFPIVERCVYLNHAAISPWPRAVIEAMGDFVDDNAANGPLNYARWLKVEERLRSRLADLLNAQSADDIALVKNTSEGLNLVAAGLDWRPGDAVVFPDGEFPSNALPWRALADRGVEVREIPLADGEDPEGPLIEALDARVRLLALSSVRYDTGLRLDLQRLGRACRRHGTLVCVDAIQHLGAAVLDLARLPVDFVIAGSHKWLLAPEGLGVFWSRPEARARLAQVQHGWRMWPDMFNFEEARQAPPATARRFEPGTLNTAGIRGLDAAAGVLLEAGAAEVERALSGPVEALIEGLGSEERIELVTPAAPDRRAGIVSFALRDADPAELYRTLAGAGIHAAVRGRLFRLSPHFYTPMAQIETTVKAIGDWLRAP